MIFILFSIQNNILLLSNFNLIVLLISCNVVVMKIIKSYYHCKLTLLNFITVFVILSGGLLVCLPKQKAAEFCNDYSSYAGCEAWVVGVVEKGNKSARIIDNPTLIEVTV